MYLKRMNRAPPRKVRVHLVRHGMSSANASHKFIGGIEAVLTPEGQKEAYDLGTYFRQYNVSFDEIYSSTYTRAKETAKITCESAGYDVQRILYDPRLVEIKRGEWEGQAIQDIYTQDEVLRMDLLGMDHGSPGGESMHDVGGRMMGWLVDTVFYKPEWTDQRDIVVFSHGLAIRCLLQRVLGFNPEAAWRWRTDNTSISTIRHDEWGWALEQFNAKPHIPYWR